MTKTGSTVIHQALHGYADGHRLLGTSIQLAKSAERDLSVLTDLSGSTGGEPFDSYLAGYPLPGTNVYAFSRTWPALEMPRPGCVWTHTLLIDRDDLVTVGIDTFHQLFRRPQTRDSGAVYSRPIVTTRLFSPGLTLPPRPFLAAILCALYAEIAQPAAFVIDKPHEVESCLLALWSQQWPALARSFKFCTGAINPRTIRGESFDLQFVPRHFYRASKWKDPSILILDRLAPAGQPPTWLDVAIDDAYVKDRPTKFNEFISLTGNEFGHDRSRFGALVDVFSRTERLLSTGGTVDAVLKVVAGQFPKEGQARHLKRALFGPSPARQVSFLAERTEGEILNALLSSRACDHRELEIRSRAAEGWRDGAIDWALLHAAHAIRTESTVARDVLAGIAAAIDADDIQHARHVEGLVKALVELRPSLLEMPQAWRGSEDEQRQFGEIMSSQSHGNIAFDEVVRAMWNSSSDAAALDVVTTGGTTAVWTVLDLIGLNEESGSPVRQLSTERWLDAVQSQPRAVIMWLNEPRQFTAASLRALSTILDPLNPDVQRIESKTWLTAVRGTGCWKLERDKIVATFILITGLMKDDSASDELICLTFDSVHKAILKQKLPKRWWDRFESVLEELPWWKRWDRAEALRLTVVKRCVEKKWPANDFLRLAEERNRLTLLIRTVRMYPCGDKYLAMLRKEAASNPDQQPKWKTRSLSEGVKLEEESLL